MTLGQKLKKARLERGMTQTQVVGSRITRNMLSQIENDQASPSVRTLEYLAAVLGVSMGWLLADDQAQEEPDRMARLRAMLRNGDAEGCMALAAEDAQPDDEQAILLAIAGASCAQKDVQDERFARAAARAEKVLAWNARSLYHSAQLDVQMRAVLAACAEGVGRGTQEAVTAYRQSYLAAQPDVDYHLLMARHHLNRQHVQAAEHEIWSITDLPEGRRAEYLILRGRLAAAKEQYETAAEYLRQADALSPLPKLLERELCRAMELCCRERQDYKAAYEYAARQLRL